MCLSRSDFMLSSAERNNDGPDRLPLVEDQRDRGSLSPGVYVVANRDRLPPELEGRLERVSIDADFRLASDENKGKSHSS